MSDDFLDVTTLPAGGRSLGPRVAELAQTERYRVGQVLGRGGMGEVRACDDVRLGRTIAIKSATGSGEGQLARFVREAQVQGQLEHPSIVPVHELGVGENGVPFFTMKRVHGETLADILEALKRGDADARERYPQRKLLQAFLRVCQAVDFAHSNGWLHRDLKPGNVMVGDYGEVYVLDWGIARRLDLMSSRPASLDPSITQPGDLLGTPGYMAPEQAEGQPTDVRSDVYALGATLFEVLSGGERLARGATTTELLLSTRDGVDARVRTRVPGVQVAPELESICVIATQHDRNRRFPSVRAMIDALDRVLAGEQDTALRAALSKSHTARALEVVRAASAPGSDEHALRTEALRELGQSLALDPANAEALKAMLALLSEPPRTIPPEARARLRHSTLEATRKLARGGALGFSLTVLPLLPALAAVRDGRMLALCFVAFLAASLPAFGIWLLPAPPRFLAPLNIVMSNVAVATLSLVTGPLLAVPAVAVSNIAGFAVGLNRRLRLLTFILGIAAVVLPVVGSMTGVLPPSFRFTSEGLLMLPIGFYFEEVPTLLVLLGYTIAAMSVPTFSVGVMRDQHRALERRRELQAWQLEQMLPRPTP